jgi:hypothetical protein
MEAGQCGNQVRDEHGIVLWLLLCGFVVLRV